jgi:predicted dehydrogenase
MKLGVGIIGLGVGEQHASAFDAHPDCELTALCDRDTAKLERVGGRFARARRYAQAAELINDPTVQIVSIASNDDDHAGQIVDALRAGKHVFAEKPLCLQREELDQISAAWRAAGGLRLSTNTVLRRSPRFRWLKQQVSDGKLGTLYCIEADYVYGRLHKLTTGWRGQIRDYSVMLGGGVHMVDLALWISGQRPIEVSAYGSSLGSSGSGFRGTDLVLAILRFESGLLVKIGANFASAYPHYHRFVAYGTAATFENLPADISPSARLWVGRDGGPPPLEVDAAYPGVAKGALIPSFVEAVLGRGEPDVTEEEGFAAVAVSLAIEQSAREQRPIRVSPVLLQP